MRSLAAFAVSLLALPLGGCLSGQTGSPEPSLPAVCDGPESCVCDPDYGSGSVILHAFGESFADGRLELVVETGSSAIWSPHRIGPGEHARGLLRFEKPCTPSKSPTSLVGAELLVSFRPGTNERYPVCPEGEDAQLCAASREAAWLDGTIRWAVPWGEQVELGGAPLSAEEISLLVDPDQCLERYPRPPNRGCDDAASSGPCTVARAPATPGATTWALLVGLVALVAATRRLTRLNPQPTVPR